jgi:hypothetical protein
MRRRDTRGGFAFSVLSKQVDLSAAFPLAEYLLFSPHAV